MKTLLTTLCLFILVTTIHAQENNLDDGYYVTVGVYAKSKEAYAKSYTEKLSKDFDSEYGYSPKREYFYVYVFSSKNFKESLSEMRRLRKETSFSDAWVYVHRAGISDVPLSEEEKEIVEKTDEAMKEKVVGGLGSIYEDKFKDVDKEEEVDDTEEVEEAPKEEKKEKAESNEEEAEEGVKLYFNAFNAQDREPIEGGEVQIIDVVRAKLLNVSKAGDSIVLGDPNNRSGKLAFIVDNFGYRKRQLPFNYHEPDETLPYIRKVGDYYVIDFEMSRYRKGDIATMYNVFFFKDASIMRPESQYELNSLLQMMKENENYRIRIHGHTNGNRAGKIISLGDSETFFALNDQNKEGYGSAKKLSEERAEIVKQYLIKNGISGDRMEIEGWGGKQMIHEKIGHSARHNVRVEIEILED